MKTRNKKIILIPTYIGVKGNKESDKTAKQAIDMLGIATRLSYTDL